MTSEKERAPAELGVFREFVERSHLPIDFGTARKQEEEFMPDIFCRLTTGEPCYFELMEVCSPEVAQLIVNAASGKSLATSASDPTREALLRKLRKTYKVPVVSLILYTNGRVISMDDQILIEAQGAMSQVRGPFSAVWLLGGQGLHRVSSVS